VSICGSLGQGSGPRSSAVCRAAYM